MQPTLDGLRIYPCIPRSMDGFTLRRVWRGAVYDIQVENPCHVQKGVAAATVDCRPLAGQVLPAALAGSTVQVTVRTG